MQGYLSVKEMRNRLAKKILRGIGIAGLVTLSVTSPYFGLGLIKSLTSKNRKKAWRQFYLSLNYLNRRGYVRIIERNANGIKAEITRKGEKVIKEFNIDSLELKKQRNWDGKWRVIVFDVPVSKNLNRLAFTEKIKELGFVMIQKSVWVYPFECYEELLMLRKFYGIEKYVSCFEAVGVEDEIEWRGKFNLKSPAAA